MTNGSQDLSKLSTLTLVQMLKQASGDSQNLDREARQAMIPFQQKKQALLQLQSQIQGELDARYEAESGTKLPTTASKLSPANQARQQKNQQEADKDKQRAATSGKGQAPAKK